MTHYYQLGGKPRPIRFGYGAILNYEKATGKSILDLNSNMAAGTVQFTEIIELIYAGYVNGCRAERTPMQETREDVCDWLDEMPQAMLEQITLQFANSFAGGKAKETTDSAPAEKN